MSSSFDNDRSTLRIQRSASITKPHPMQARDGLYDLRNSDQIWQIASPKNSPQNRLFFWEAMLMERRWLKTWQSEVMLRTPFLKPKEKRAKDGSSMSRLYNTNLSFGKTASSCDHLLNTLGLRRVVAGTSRRASFILLMSSAGLLNELHMSLALTLRQIHVYSNNQKHSTTSFYFHLITRRPSKDTTAQGRSY